VAARRNVLEDSMAGLVPQPLSGEHKDAKAMFAAMGEWATAAHS
jgi:hypothetical protein